MLHSVLLLHYSYIVELCITEVPANTTNLPYEIVKSENANHWGKHYSMAGLQFYKYGFNCFTTYE